MVAPPTDPIKDESPWATESDMFVWLNTSWVPKVKPACIAPWVRPLPKPKPLTAPPAPAPAIMPNAAANVGSALHLYNATELVKLLTDP